MACWRVLQWSNLLSENLDTICLKHWANKRMQTLAYMFQIQNVCSCLLKKVMYFFTCVSTYLPIMHGIWGGNCSSGKVYVYLDLNGCSGGNYRASVLTEAHRHHCSPYNSKCEVQRRLLWIYAKSDSPNHGIISSDSTGDLTMMITLKLYWVFLRVKDLRTKRVKTEFHRDQ